MGGRIALCVLAVAALSCGGEPERLPAELIGTWRTASPDLRESYFELREGWVVFGADRYRLSMYPIHRVESSRAGGATEYAIEYLKRVSAHLFRDALRVRTSVGVGQPAQAIRAFAQTHGVDLIAMATHRYSGAVRYVLGSVADAVVHRADVPVLLVRPSEAPLLCSPPFRNRRTAELERPFCGSAVRPNGDTHIKRPTSALYI